MHRSKRSRLLLFLRGIAIGVADIVPGVSGGTIAFISGIYKELVDSLKAFPGMVKKIFRIPFREFLEKSNAGFLGVLFSGVLVGIFSFSNVVLYMVKNHGPAVWSFFIGLLVVSAWLIIRRVKEWNFYSLAGVVAGTFIAYTLTVIGQSHTPEGLWFMFITGMIVSSVMILPGISGSFILMVLGKYKDVLLAVKTVDMKVLTVYGLGIIAGLMAFTRVLSWMLRRHHDNTIALLIGFLIGSLNKIWPWKQVQQVINMNGEVLSVKDKNLLPQDYELITGNSPNVLLCILSAIAGFMIVFIIERIAHRKKKWQSTD